MILYKKIINNCLKKFELKTIHTKGKEVYLTYDDGPEPGITEFVLNELSKYGFKATFFCRGDNAERHPDLLKRLREEGHAIGNHTYSHLHAYETLAKTYMEDVKHADEILHTNLFRPPHGSLTLKTWYLLRGRKIVYWALNSGDSEREKFNFGHAINKLKTNTHSGDVVLFHFCHRHENETKQILPAYLKWLSDNGYEGKALE